MSRITCVHLFKPLILKEERRPKDLQPVVPGADIFGVSHFSSFHFGDFPGAGWAAVDDEAAGLAMAGGGPPAYSFKSSPDVTSTTQPQAPKMTVNPKWHASCPPPDSESSVAENSTLLGEGTDITADSLDRL